MSAVIDARRLRELREARDWNQQTLARMAGVAPSVVSRLERDLQDDLNASVLIALARALGVAVDALLAKPAQVAMPSSLVYELDVVWGDLARLSEAQQRQVAALLRAYIAAIPA